MPVDEILWKRTRHELTNLLMRTGERYEKIKEQMKKDRNLGVDTSFDRYDPKKLEKQFEKLKKGGFPVYEGKPPA